MVHPLAVFKLVAKITNDLASARIASVKHNHSLTLFLTIRGENISPPAAETRRVMTARWRPPTFFAVSFRRL
jgi:hypothetical protein